MAANFSWPLAQLRNTVKMARAWRPAVIAGVVAVVLIAATSRQLQTTEGELLSLDDAKSLLAAQTRLERDVQKLKGSKKPLSSLIYEPFRKLF